VPKVRIFVTALHLSSSRCNIFEKNVPHQNHCQGSLIVY
jgi:hypothetical protein